MIPMEKEVHMAMNDGTTVTAHQADIREIIEEKLEEKTGIFASLQEDVDDDEYLVYLHTDALEELEEEQLETLEKMNITEDPEQTTEAIKKIWGIRFSIENEKAKKQ